MLQTGSSILTHHLCLSPACLSSIMYVLTSFNTGHAFIKFTFFASETYSILILLHFT